MYEKIEFLCILNCFHESVVSYEYLANCDFVEANQMYSFYIEKLIP